MLPSPSFVEEASSDIGMACVTPESVLVSGGGLGGGINDS